MVAFDAAITWEVSIAFDLPRMAGIARFRFAGFPLRADDRVNLMLRKIGDGLGLRSRRIPSDRWREGYRRLIWGGHGVLGPGDTKGVCYRRVDRGCVANRDDAGYSEACMTISSRSAQAWAWLCWDEM